MKTRFLKFALLAVFCVGAATTNAQTNLSEEAVKVIKELKQVDTKGLSAEEMQTALKVLNQIKKQHSDNFVAITAVGEAKASATPAKNGEAKLGSKSNPMVFDMTTGMGMKPIRVKYVIDGREVTSSEYFDVMQLRGNVGAKHKTLRDKESLAKYNAQGYDMVWLMETVRVEKSTAKTPTKPASAESAKNNEARVGTAENPMDISMMLTSGKQVRAKYILDGREITSSEYWDISMIRGNKGLKTKMFKDKESLAKYNAQGYDEVWVLETVNIKKSKEEKPENTKVQVNPQQAQSANVQVITRGEMKPIRIKYFIDGREVPMQEYMNVMSTRPEAKTKSYRDKESLEKYKAQGYDMVWCMETKVNIEKNELPMISKFKQKGNQVSFRIEVPKSAEHAKQKVDIEYEL